MLLMFQPSEWSVTMAFRRSTTPSPTAVPPRFVLYRGAFAPSRGKGRMPQSGIRGQPALAKQVGSRRSFADSSGLAIGRRHYGEVSPSHPAPVFAAGGEGCHKPASAASLSPAMRPRHYGEVSHAASTGHVTKPAYSCVRGMYVRCVTKVVRVPRKLRTSENSYSEAV